MIVASLAKAFGVPLAMIAGPPDLVASTWQRGPTVVHSSPPSAPVGLAAIRALHVNGRVGDRLRDRLLALLDRLHGRLGRGGIRVDSERFPVVRVPVPTRRRLPAWSMPSKWRAYELCRWPRPVWAAPPLDWPSTPGSVRSISTVRATPCCWPCGGRRDGRRGARFYEAGRRRRGTL